MYEGFDLKHRKTLSLAALHTSLLAHGAAGGSNRSTRRRLFHNTAALNCVYYGGCTAGGCYANHPGHREEDSPPTQQSTGPSPDPLTYSLICPPPRVVSQSNDWAKKKVSLASG